MPQSHFYGSGTDWLFYDSMLSNIGQASGQNAASAGEMAKKFADLSWGFAQKQNI